LNFGLFALFAGIFIAITIEQADPVWWTFTIVIGPGALALMVVSAKDSRLKAACPWSAANARAVPP